MGPRSLGAELRGAGVAGGARADDDDRGGLGAERGRGGQRALPDPQSPSRTTA